MPSLSYNESNDLSSCLWRCYLSLWFTAYSNFEIQQRFAHDAQEPAHCFDRGFKLYFLCFSVSFRYILLSCRRYRRNKITPDEVLCYAQMWNHHCHVIGWPRNQVFSTFKTRYTVYRYYPRIASRKTYLLQKRHRLCRWTNLVALHSNNRFSVARLQSSLYSTPTFSRIFTYFTYSRQQLFSSAR